MPFLAQYRLLLWLRFLLLRLLLLWLCCLLRCRSRARLSLELWTLLPALLSLSNINCQLCNQIDQRT